MAWSCGLLNGTFLAMFDIKITFHVVLLIVVDSFCSLPLNWTCQSTLMLCVHCGGFCGYQSLWFDLMLAVQAVSSDVSRIQLPEAENCD